MKLRPGFEPTLTAGSAQLHYSDNPRITACGRVIAWRKPAPQAKPCRRCLTLATQPKDRK